MERLERFYKIDQLLKDREVVSFAAFMQALGMSRASVKRDLDYMRDRFNAPIEYDRELLMEILKFGADVEVLGPQALRGRVAEALRNAARRYDR